MTEHQTSPPNPKDGDTFSCTYCGLTWKFDGPSGQWVQTGREQETED